MFYICSSVPYSLLDKLLLKTVDMPRQAQGSRMMYTKYRVIFKHYEFCYDLKHRFKLIINYSYSGSIWYVDN